MIKESTEGFEEFEKLLIQMAEDFGYKETARNVLIPSVKVALEPVLISAKAMARTDTGKMRESIKLEARIPNFNDKKSSSVDVNDAVIGLVSAKQSKVSLGEEFGTKEKSGHPFLRPALESNVEIVVRRLSSALAFRLDNYQSRKYKGK
jgi:HK97 gp10 family phage protein